MKSVLRGIPDRPAFSSSHCDGFVRLMAAPEQRFDTAAAMLDGIDIAPRANTQWLQAYMQRQQEEGREIMDKMRRDSDARMKAQADNFAQSQAVRQRMHEQFLFTMQRGTDMSMQRAADVANSNHRMASDVVDYALDQQTVRDPNTGQITWVDSTGKTSYQTSDPNATPQGSLPGNWTRQQVVHGDGSYLTGGDGQFFHGDAAGHLGRGLSGSLWAVRGRAAGDAIADAGGDCAFTRAAGDCDQ